jgi:hypothetical protein
VAQEALGHFQASLRLDAYTHVGYLQWIEAARCLAAYLEPDPPDAEADSGGRLFPWLYAQHGPEQNLMPSRADAHNIYNYNARLGAHTLQCPAGPPCGPGAQHSPRETP